MTRPAGDAERPSDTAAHLVDLQHLRAQRAALADFGYFAFRCDDLDQLLNRAAELVSEALKVDLVKILEHHPERGELLIRSGVNWEPGVVGRVALGDHARSPAGYALQREEAVISRDVATEKRFEIPEVLVRHGVHSMINVLIAGPDAPYGVLEVDSRQHRDFSRDDVDFLRNYANLLAAAVERLRQHQDLAQVAREQRVLARELSHRVKNVLSLVQAIASQTTAEGRSAEEYKTMFVGRLQALSAAESLMFEERGDMVDPRQIAEEVLTPYLAERPQTILIEGPTALLTARRGRMVGLAIHELATNAVRHGALSVADGRVRLTWRLEREHGPAHLTMTWQETDGPEVVPPQREGFGTLLLNDIVAHELKGSATLTYGRAGLTYELSFELERPQP